LWSPPSPPVQRSITASSSPLPVDYRVSQQPPPPQQNVSNPSTSAVNNPSTSSAAAESESESNANASTFQNTPSTSAAAEQSLIQRAAAQSDSQFIESFSVGRQLETSDFGPHVNIIKPMTASAKPFKSNASARVYLNVLKYDASKPHSPTFKLLSQRVKSFKNWPQQDTGPKIIDIAQAGWFMVDSYRVSCYYCGGVLNVSELGWDPWMTHVYFFSKCNHVLIVKGNAFVNKCIQSMLSAYLVDDDDDDERPRPRRRGGSRKRKHLSIAFQQKKRKKMMLDYKGMLEKESGGDFKQRLSQFFADPNWEAKIVKSTDEDLFPIDNTCNICLEQEKCIVFLPCAHLFACGSCSTSVTECPVCKSEIKGFVKIFNC
jgi:hypothetical protein